MKALDVVKTTKEIEGLPAGTRATLVEETIPGSWIAEAYLPMEENEWKTFGVNEEDLELIWEFDDDKK
jgi:hypothetical protein